MIHTNIKVGIIHNSGNSNGGYNINNNFYFYNNEFDYKFKEYYDINKILFSNNSNNIIIDE